MHHRPGGRGGRRVVTGDWVGVGVALALVTCAMGCRPSGQLRLRVDEAAYGRLPERLRTMVDQNAGRELQKAREEQQSIAEAEAKARRHLAASDAEPREAAAAKQRAQVHLREASQSKEAVRLEQARLELHLAEASEAVTVAKRAWLQAELRFQEASSLAGRQRVTAVEAQLERVKAELLTESGGKDRTERFQGQYDSFQRAWREATEEVTRARAEKNRQLDLLNEAKARYAAVRTGTAPSATPAAASPPPAASPPVATTAPAVTAAPPSPAATATSSKAAPAKAPASSSSQPGPAPARSTSGGSKATR